MPTVMPSDNNSFPIPCVRLRSGGAHHITAASSENTNTSPFLEGTIIIAIFATVDVYIKFGATDAVAATSSDHFFPANVYYNFAINPTDKYISVLRVGSSDGMVHISENE